MEVVRTESLKVYPTLPEPERPRRHGHPHGGPWWRKAPEPPKTREQLAFEEARRAVDARVGFYRHAIFYGLFILFILFTGGLEPAVVVGLLWGMGLATHGYNAIVAPNLRKKWLEEEYRLRLGPGELQARRQIEGKHAKSLEELSASIAHEIRNPITAAKSLVQQMGEDPTAARTSSTRRSPWTSWIGWSARSPTCSATPGTRPSRHRVHGARWTSRTPRWRPSEGSPGAAGGARCSATTTGPLGCAAIPRSCAAW
jgi:signal transduction histidine kinase